jgi:hypothetical protein
MEFVGDDLMSKVEKSFESWCSVWLAWDEASNRRSVLIEFLTEL